MKRFGSFLLITRFVSLRGIRQSPLRTALAALGVALGVALYLSIGIINASTLDFFADSVNAVAGKTAVTVSAGEAGMPEDVSDRLERLPSVKYAVPRIESRAYYPSVSGAHGRTMVVLGVDLLKEWAVRTYKADGDRVLDDPLVFLNQANSIVLTKELAAERGLKLDDTFDLLTAGGKKQFTVRGLLSPTGAAKAFGGSIAIMDIDGARVMFGKDGKTDKVDIVGQDGVAVSSLVADLRAALGPGFLVEEPNAQVEAFGKMVGAYQQLLSFLSGVALLIAMCLVWTAVSLAVNERRREMAIVRSLGGTRTALVLAVLTEAGLLGAVASAAGVPIGRLLAAALVGLISKSMSGQFVTPIDVATLHMPAFAAVQGIAIGAFAALVAAAWPAWQSTKIDALDALRAREKDHGGKTSNRLLAGTTLAGAIMLGALLLPGAFVSSLPGAVTAFAAVAGACLVTPGLVILLAYLASQMCEVLRDRAATLIPTLALRNLLRAPRRTISGALMLLVGVLFVILSSILHASLRGTITESVRRAFLWELVVSSEGNVATSDVQPLHQHVLDDVRAFAGAIVGDPAAVSGKRQVRTPYEGKVISLVAFDTPSAHDGYAVYDAIEGSPEALGREVFFGAEPTVVVSEVFARNFGKAKGETIALDTPTGRHEARIAGLVSEFSSPVGYVSMKRDLYLDWFQDPLVTAIGIHVARDKVEMLRDALDTKFGRELGLVTMTNEAVREQLTRAIDDSFAYIGAIEIAALAVGLLGLLTNALAGVGQRMRELGVMRAVGASKAQLGALLVTESLVQGALAGAVAVLVGVYVAHAWLSRALTTQLGWTIHISIPWALPLSSGLASVFVGTVVGALAASYAGRMPIRDAIEYE